MIENGQPVGVVLTMEEYELLRSKSQTPTLSPPYQGGERGGQAPYQGGEKEGVAVPNPIGETMIKEMDFPKASAAMEDIDLADAGDVTLEDLGLDELPY